MTDREKELVKELLDGSRRIREAYNKILNALNSELPLAAERAYDDLKTLVNSIREAEKELDL